jgi:hypothetical protein
MFVKVSLQCRQYDMNIKHLHNNGRRMQKDYLKI